MTIALSLLLKTTLVMTLALAGARLATRARAAVRHAMLVAAFAVLWLLPLTALMPAISIPIALPTEMSAAVQSDAARSTDSEPALDLNTDVVDLPVTAAVEPAPIADRSPSSGTRIVGLWAVGAVLFILPAAVGLWRARVIRRTAVAWPSGTDMAVALARETGLRRSINVLRHPAVSGPITMGVWHPVVVMPIDADAWQEADLHRALVHELEHVRRADWLSHCLSRVIAAVYWFHPIVWLAWRQLSLEAERACDDAVLRASEPTAYAEQLVALAQRMSVRRHEPHLAMASRRDLAARVRAVLDVDQARGRAGALCVVAAGVFAITATATSSIQIVQAMPVLPSVHESLAVVAGGPIVPPLASFADVSSRLSFEQRAGAAATRATSATFDVVSIKPCAQERITAGVAPPPPPGARGGGAGGWQAQTTPGRVYWDCVSLASLVDLAYADRDHPLLNVSGGAAPTMRGPKDPVRAERVRGGPAWATSEKFTIEAVASPELTKAALAGSTGRNLGVLSPELSSALRVVLEDRFQVKVRRVTEDQDMYALVVAESGLNTTNVTVPVAGDCVSRERYFEVMASANPPSRADAPKICGVASLTRVGDLFAEQYNSSTFAQLAATFSGWQGMDRHVLDQTGIDAPFNFRFKQGDSSVAAERIATGLAPLGLKLKPVKAPAEYLMIDRAERPRPNAPVVTLASYRIPPRPAQTPAKPPAFDVVSIKPCSQNNTTPGVAAAQPGARGGGAGGWQAQTTPGRVYWNCATLASLVDLAYADRDHPLLNTTGNAAPPRTDGLGPVKPKRVRGGASWVTSEMYTIEATGPAELTASALSGSTGRNLTTLSPELAAALRAVLEDRFQLTVRRVTEEQEMFALTVSEAGINKTSVTPPVAGDCVSRERYFELIAAAPPPRSLAEAEAQPRICGAQFSTMAGMEFSSSTFAQLANYLSTSRTERFVLDRTGVDTKFNFKFKQGTGDTNDDKAASGVAALGLKLQSTKAPAEFLMIDRAEKPRPNHAA